MQEIYVDFNTMQQFMDDEHVIIGQTDHPGDGALRLCEGERIIVYDEEFSVEVIAYLERNFWIGLINWTTKKTLIPQS